MLVGFFGSASYWQKSMGVILAETASIIEHQNDTLTVKRTKKE